MNKHKTYRVQLAFVLPLFFISCSDSGESETKTAEETKDKTVSDTIERDKINEENIPDKETGELTEEAIGEFDYVEFTLKR